MLGLGSKQYGAADETARQAVEQLDDLDRLDRMTDRLISATSWADLLATE